MLNPKTERIVYLTIMGLIIAIGLFFAIHDSIKEHKAWLVTYKKSAFNGVIKDTVHIPGHNDLPTYYFTNHSSHFSGFEEIYMHGFAKIGDSLSKERGRRHY